MFGFVDTDLDGLDDNWELANFMNLGQTASGDFEKDGTDNLTEFRLGLNPKSGGSRFAATRAANGLIQWPGKSGVTFTIQRSETLVFTEASNIATVRGTAGLTGFTDPSPLSSPKVFYRVRLEP